MDSNGIEGDTALMHASATGHEGTVRVLLEAGRRLRRRDASGGRGRRLTPRMVAVATWNVARPQVRFAWRVASLGLSDDAAMSAQGRASRRSTSGTPRPRYGRPAAPLSHATRPAAWGTRGGGTR